MLRELTWDSSFFGRKMGELVIGSEAPSDIGDILNKARDEGFKYLVCKIRSQNTLTIRLLESAGFYLADIGVTLAIQSDMFLGKKTQEGKKISGSIRVPAARDIPMLRKIVKSLFLESRFYNDPFFSKGEAERLYSEWIKNSVIGQAAEAVYWIPETGFITCRKFSKKSGEIALIGIKKGLRGKGFGRELIDEAMRWFREQKIKTVTVRTQLKNISAINFYFRLGFLIKEYDIVFGKIL